MPRADETSEPAAGDNAQVWVLEEASLSAAPRTHQEVLARFLSNAARRAEVARYVAGTSAAQLENDIGSEGAALLQQFTAQEEVLHSTDAMVTRALDFALTALLPETPLTYDLLQQMTECWRELPGTFVAAGRQLSFSSAPQTETFQPALNAVAKSFRSVLQSADRTLQQAGVLLAKQISSSSRKELQPAFADLIDTALGYLERRSENSAARIVELKGYFSAAPTTENGVFTEPLAA